MKILAVLALLAVSFTASKCTFNNTPASAVDGWEGITQEN